MQLSMQVCWDITLCFAPLLWATVPGQGQRVGYIVRHALSPFAGLGDEFGNDYADGPVRRVRLDRFRDAACLVQEIGVFLMR